MEGGRKWLALLMGFTAVRDGPLHVFETGELRYICGAKPVDMRQIYMYSIYSDSVLLCQNCAEIIKGRGSDGSR